MGMEHICNARSEILKWCVENGVPFAASDVVNLIAKNNAEMSRWLLENSCPLSESVMIAVGFSERKIVAAKNYMSRSTKKQKEDVCFQEMFLNN
jgi:hypothetical protein